MPPRSRPPARSARALAKVGNLASDGRPILGLDSRHLLEITLYAGPGCYLVPAHIWTPWFAVLGSKSGFDSVSDCYLDLAEHVFAVETGLSSDPPMNWMCSALDRYRLVSNSDAHSPPMIGREATTFSTELDYFAMAAALRTGTAWPVRSTSIPKGAGTTWMGTANADVRFEPATVQRHGGHLPGLWQTAHDWRAAPRMPNSLTARLVTGRRGAAAGQSGVPARDRRRDPRQRTAQQEGHRRGGPAGRRTRTGIAHPAGGRPGGYQPGWRQPARRGDHPAAPRRGDQGSGLRRGVRGHPPAAPGGTGRARRPCSICPQQSGRGARAPARTGGSGQHPGRSRCPRSPRHGIAGDGSARCGSAGTWPGGAGRAGAGRRCADGRHGRCSPVSTPSSGQRRRRPGR